MMEEDRIKELERDNNSLKMQIKEADEFISSIEDDCSAFVNELLTKVCKRAIRRMNRDMRMKSGKFSPVSLCDDLPKSFTFFDQLVILQQTRDYDEMGFPPNMLSDYIEGVLDDELSKLALIERLILSYSSCRGYSSYSYETCDIRQELYEKFNEIKSKHYECKKIQSYLDSHWF